MDFSWLFCLYVFCADPAGHIANAQPTSTNDQQQQQTNGQEQQQNEKDVVREGEITGEEKTIISDTGEPPGGLAMGQADQPLREVIEDAVGEVTDEMMEGDAEIIPSIHAPPVIEEIPASDASGIRPRQEGRKEPASSTQEVEDGEDLTEVEAAPSGNPDALPPSEDSGKERADDVLLDHSEETQIGAPALASATDPSGGGTQVAEQDQILSDDKPKEAENVTGALPVVKHDDEDEAILMSYNEWKEKQLEKELEEQEKLYGSQNADVPPSSKQRQFGDEDSKNYGSSDCGAKIISANKEAQKANHILNFNRDEYMINPCSANIWFVVELCEPIQIKLLEMANLELFSSVPESFAVYTSDRYPAREWRSLGTRFAKEQRILQSFQFNEHLFTKFVKIELLTFFGHEHYCPLTVLRIFGTSMEEEIDAEEIGDAVLPPSPTPLAEDTKENGILDHAKDVVVSFVKNAAKVFTGGDKGTAECQGEGCPDLTIEGVDPTPATDCWEGEFTTSIPDVQPADDLNICASPCDDLDSEDFTGICAAALCDQPDYWRIFPNCCLLVLAHTTIHLCCGISHCCFIPAPPHAGERRVVSETAPEGAMEKTSMITPSLKISPLEIIPSANRLIISNLSKNRASSLLTPSPIIPTIVQTPPTVISSSTPTDSNPTVKAVGTPAPMAPGTPAQTDPKGPEGTQESHGEIKTISPTPSWEEEEDLEAPTKSPLPELDHTGEKTATLQANSAGTAEMSLKPADILQETEQDPVGAGGEAKVIQGQEGAVVKVDSPPPAPKCHSPPAGVVTDQERDVACKKEDDGAGTAEAQDPSSGASAMTGNIPQDPPTVEDKTARKGDGAIVEEVKVGIRGESSGLKEESEAARGKEASGSQQTGKVIEPVPSNGAQTVPVAGISSYGSQKDTLFMRLNNKIKSLELNLSLSSKYLEELSKSYKKQMEEMQKSFNKTVSSLTETVQKSQQKHQNNSEDITRIDSEVQELSSRVSALSMKTEDIFQEVIERHLFLMVCEVLFFCTLFLVCIRRERNQLRLARAMYEHHREPPQRRNTLSHSNPSQHSPRVTAPGMGSLRSSGSLDDLLIIGPTTPLREAIRVNTSHHHSKPAKTKHKSASSGVMTNGSLPDMTGQGHSQLTKGPKRKTDYRLATKQSHSMGDIMNGSSSSDIERSKSATNGYGRHSPENIGTVNGSHGSKLKKSQNGTKVKRL